MIRKKAGLAEGFFYEGPVVHLLCVVGYNQPGLGIQQHSWRLLTGKLSSIVNIM